MSSDRAATPQNLVNVEPRTLGDLTVGPISYGLWRFTDDDLETSTALIETALDNGMNLVDTSDVYGFDWGGTGFGMVEELLGSVLAANPKLRDDMVLATKGGIAPPTPYNSSAPWLREACEGSLRRLNTDVIDLYQVHRPDMFTHPAEVAGTLAALRSEGKIREVGISNHTVAQHDALAAHLPFAIATTQPEYSVLELGPLRDGTFDRAMSDGVTPLAWSPLGGGRLFSTGGDGPPVELVKVLDRLAEREGVDRAAIAVAFVLAHPSRPVAIVGTQNLDRIAATRQALTVQLDRADVYEIVQASEGVPLP